MSALYTTDGAGGLTVLASDTGELRVNGVQIAGAVPAQILITQFSIKPNDGIGTLTFSSEPEATYTIFGSSNLRSSNEASWTEIESNFNSGGHTTTKDFIDFDVLGEPTRFYRLGKVP